MVYTIEKLGQRQHMVNNQTDDIQEVCARCQNYLHIITGLQRDYQSLLQSYTYLKNKLDNGTNILPQWSAYAN